MIKTIMIAGALLGALATEGMAKSCSMSMKCTASNCGSNESVYRDCKKDCSSGASNCFAAGAKWEKPKIDCSISAKCNRVTCAADPKIWRDCQNECTSGADKCIQAGRDAGYN